MPNIKSAKKRVKTDAKKKLMNKDAISSMRTAIKKAKIATKENNKEAKELVNAAITKIDKTASKGLIHKNKASRAKSKLMKNLNVK